MEFCNQVRVVPEHRVFLHAPDQPRVDAVDIVGAKLVDCENADVLRLAVAQTGAQELDRRLDDIHLDIQLLASGQHELSAILWGTNDLQRKLQLAKLQRTRDLVDRVRRSSGRQSLASVGVNELNYTLKNSNSSKNTNVKNAAKELTSMVA